MAQPNPSSPAPGEASLLGGSAVPAQPPPPGPRGARAVLWRVAAALAYRDFRVLWFGACTSSIGTWMQKVAQAWLVLELTNSAWYLALDSFVAELPLLLFTLIGGVVADRRNRRKLLLASQLVQMSSAFALAALVGAGRVTIWHVLGLAFTSGCAQAFGGPAYQALIPSLVSKADLPNAIALNSIQFNIARLLGPLLAGVALHQLGMVWCFGLNGVSFLVVIGALLSLHVKHVPPASQRHMLEELQSGLGYVRREGRLVALMVLAFAVTFFGMPLLTFLPLVARSVFHEGVGQYSRMMAFAGAGAIAGALVVAWLGRFRHMGLVALLVQVAVGVMIAAFAWSRVLWISEVLLFTSGVALVISTSLVTSLVQLIAPNELRGRVMSTYMMAFRGGMPLGSLVSGKIADATSAPIALAIDGVLLALVAGYFLTRKDVRIEP